MPREFHHACANFAAMAEHIQFSLQRLRREARVERRVRL